MAENSKIEWCDHTFNPWEGCTKVSPGCEHCYAEARDQRFTGGIHWGKGAFRRRTRTWGDPKRWNGWIWRQCRACGHRWGKGDGYCPICSKNECDIVRPRVFSASLADWLDDEVPIEWLADFLDLIRLTPHLDWLLLTKRPENFRPRLSQILELMGDHLTVREAFLRTFVTLMLTGGWVDSIYIAPEIGRENYWIGTTVEDQVRADQRIPHLLGIPAKVRFLSCEPLLGPVEFSDVSRRSDYVSVLGKPALAGIHWVIAGGESGKQARPMRPDWARGLRDQCGAVGVPFLFKQWGEWAPCPAKEDSSSEPWCDVAYGEFHDGGHWIDDCMCDGGGPTLYRVGKNRAGRIIDGVEHNGFPEVGQ